MTLNKFTWIMLFCFVNTNAVQVKIAQGWLEGQQLETVTDSYTYYSFKGIPYAKPPVGSLRFMPPEDAESWDGVRNATNHGSFCPQYNTITEEFTQGDEDCLFLNVYTPKINSTLLLPVLFFIHGGGYLGGNGNVDIYGPDYLVTNNIVVVTINYRLGAFGFLTMDTEKVPGNMGMKDQVVALKWVNQNIECFGGDPKNVTIMGQSAGSASVIFHVVSPMSKGLFNRIISMSGVPTNDFNAYYQPAQRSYLLGKLLGKETNNADELLEFLQSVPALNILHSQVNVSILSTEALLPNNVLKSMYFTPIVEKDFGIEQFLTQDPIEALKSGNVNKADIFIGNTNEETVTAISDFERNVINFTNSFPEAIVPRNILYYVTPNTALKVANLTHYHYFGNKSITSNSMRNFITYANEAYFTTAISRFVNVFPEDWDRKIYYYIFSSFSKLNLFGNRGTDYGIYGAGHIDDLMYLFFATSLNVTLYKNSTEYRMVKLTNTVFTNFVKCGNPTPDNTLGLIWPEYNNVNRSYVEIVNTTLVPGTNPNKDAVKFWASMFEEAGLEF